MKAYQLETIYRHRQEITEIFLHHCGLTRVPDVVYDCPRLCRLEITRNELTSLPGDIHRLSQLERLSFAGNRLSQLPPELSRLSRLRSLDLSGNVLNRLPDLLFDLTELEELLLAGNNLADLQPAIGRLRRLRRLDLSGNSLSRLPAAFGRLENLRELNLNDNRLRRLPPAPATLERLEAAGNRLKDLPPDLFLHWPGLTHLNLAGNRLVYLPPALGHCRQLAHLDAARNRLTTAPPELGRLAWLLRLDLHGNRLRSVPDELGGCRLLQRLDLSDNDLTGLPPGLERLPRLDSLGLARNRLSGPVCLPPTLKELSLARNDLVALPAGLAGLSTLRELDLSYNRLRELPPALGRLRDLRRLDLRGNPLEGPPLPLLLLDKLDTLAGLPRYRSPLLAFLTAARRQGTPEALRRPLFEVMTGRAGALTALSLPDLLVALNFPRQEVRLAARRHLVEQRGRPADAHPLTAGCVVSLLGKTPLAIEPLRRRLAERRIDLLPEPGDRTTHVVVGDRPAPDSRLHDGLVFLSPVRFNDWPEQKEENPPVSPGGTRRLRELLLHPEARNVRLAVQVLQAGVPRELLTDLFFAWKTTRTARLKRDLRRLLELGLPEKDRFVLSMRFGLPADLENAEAERRLQAWTKDTVLDGERLRELIRAGR